MMPRLLPILYYHHVGERREPLGHRRLWISRDRFAEQMSALARAGYRCVSLGEAAPVLRGQTAAAEKLAVLTFDDGYENFYRHAYPVLQDYKFAATVFVVTREIGGSSRWDAGFETALMDWPQLREVSRGGIEIASHTVSHPRLATLPLEHARRELVESRRELEERLGIAATSFAYPYGNHDRRIQQLAEEAGYALACSIRRGNLHRRADLFRLKRVPVDEFTSLPRFHRRLMPLYDLTCRWQRFHRALRGRAAGEDG
jgi:peptidoglycan/xylan/chitin deacetylase (PgdA/CDA1 family)